MDGRLSLDVTACSNYVFYLLACCFRAAALLLQMRCSFLRATARWPARCYNYSCARLPIPLAVDDMLLPVLTRWFFTDSDLWHRGENVSVRALIVAKKSQIALSVCVCVCVCVCVRDYARC